MVDVQLPRRIFVAGEEPTAERLNSASISAWQTYRNGREATVFRQFWQYRMVRLLRVNKKYEIWILFAGRPIRMSLREFALVTGLKCVELPKLQKKKKRNPMKAKPYFKILYS